MMKDKNPMVEKPSKQKLGTGYIVFGSLAAIKILEYVISKLVPAGDFLYLLALALVSAGLIIWYYKHIYELFGSKNKENNG
jgi:hypothetical protein